jgi:hypothetical protein
MIEHLVFKRKENWVDRGSIFTIIIVFALSLTGAIIGMLVGAIVLPTRFLDGKVNSIGDILTPQDDRDKI